MKQFSDLQACDLSLNFILALKPIYLNGSPGVKVLYNHRVIYDDHLSHALDLCWTEKNILEPITISIQLYDKKYDAMHETAVVIKSLKIDDFDFVPNYTQHATYHNDHNLTDPTAYLGFNGIWTISINQPFYHWYHQITGQGWLIY